jgi:5-methylcytosine-specific restriction protein A
MRDFFSHIKDRIEGKAKKGQRRSGSWRTVRARHLIGHDHCFVCGQKSKLEVHHVIPFSVAPHLELDPENLVSLCENKKYGINCHLLIGHLGNYRRTNVSFWQDAVTWAMKLDKVESDDIMNG